MSENTTTAALERTYIEAIDKHIKYIAEQVKRFHGMAEMAASVNNNELVERCRTRITAYEDAAKNMQKIYKQIPTEYLMIYDMFHNMQNPNRAQA